MLVFYNGLASPNEATLVGSVEIGFFAGRNNDLVKIKSGEMEKRVLGILRKLGPKNSQVFIDILSSRRLLFSMKHSYQRSPSPRDIKLARAGSLSILGVMGWLQMPHRAGQTSLSAPR